jgi:hypothetical protein
MSGAPLDGLKSRLVRSALRNPGIPAHVAMGRALGSTPLAHADYATEPRGKNLQSSGVYGRDRLITMPWGVDVAQRGTHHVVESCKSFQSRRLCQCALRTSHLMTSEAASTRARSVQEASPHREHVDDEACINTIRTLAIATLDDIKRFCQPNTGTRPASRRLRAHWARAVATASVWLSRHRGHHRHARFRRVGPVQGRAKKVRLHARTRHESRQITNCEITKRQGADCKDPTPMNPVSALQQHGQSVWLDFLGAR